MTHPAPARAPKTSRSAFWTLLVAGSLIWPAGAAIAVATPLAAGTWLAAAGFALIAIGMVAGFAGTRRLSVA